MGVVVKVPNDNNQSPGQRTAKQAGIQHLRKKQVAQNEARVVKESAGTLSVAENFLGRFKTEQFFDSTSSTREEEEANSDGIDYIEMFYNSNRRHSYLGLSQPIRIRKADGIEDSRLRKVSIFFLTTSEVPGDD